MAIETKFWTVAEAAREIGVSGARVRQLCIELKIGTIVGNMRLLEQKEVDRLKAMPDRRTKNFRNNS